MRIAATICRYLLGLMFTFFGLNGFLHFLPAQLPGGLAGQFMGAFVGSHWATVVFFFQLVSGVLLLVNRFVPMALTVLGPIIVNILLFHILMAPAGLPPGVLAAILWFVVFYSVRSAFAGIFLAQVPAQK